MKTSANLTLRAYVVFGALSMFYMMLVLSSAVLTNKVIQVGPAITLGGVLIVPFVFCVSDILTELYGYKATYIILQLAFGFQFIFALITHISISLPSPGFWHGQENYAFVFAPLMKMSFASYFCYTISTMINIYIINKWRILWRGRLFWIRSIGSSTLGELVYSISIIVFMNYQYPISVLVDMAFTSYAVKLIFALILALPANLLVYILKEHVLHKSTPLLVSNDVLNPFAAQENVLERS